MTGACLREGGAADVDSAMTVMVRAFDPIFGEAWSRGQCLGILSLPDVWLSLAEDPAGTVVGFTLSRMTVDEAELLLLAVDPAARRQGIGAALIARAATVASARGARRLLLEMRADNPALTLYERAGFAAIGRRQGYYRGAGGQVRDAITLARTLYSPD